MIKFDVKAPGAERCTGYNLYYQICDGQNHYCIHSPNFPAVSPSQVRRARVTRVYPCDSSCKGDYYAEVLDSPPFVLKERLSR